MAAQFQNRVGGPTPSARRGRIVGGVVLVLSVVRILGGAVLVLSVVRIEGGIAKHRAWTRGAPVEGSLTVVALIRRLGATLARAFSPVSARGSAAIRHTLDRAALAARGSPWPRPPGADRRLEPTAAGLA